MVKKELILEGLDCANCASKIETQVKAIPGVQNAYVDFVSQKLTLEINSPSKIVSIVEEASAIATSVEPGICVLENTARETRKEEKEDYKELIILGIGIVLYALAFILPLSPLAEKLIFLASYLFVGTEVLLKALKNIFKGQVFDENFLMALATIGAFAIGEFPEAVAVMVFYQIGEFFQDLAVNRSRKSIQALMDIRPDYAHLKLEDGSKVVSPEEVTIGDLILVKPGEKIPLDGIVVEGTSTLDTSALTGESLPREVKAEDEVLSGSINQRGLLTIKVTKLFSESTVSKILDLVQNASSKKAPTENFITKFARYYTPAVVISAALLAFLPPLMIPGATFSEWVYRALIFLVISCPCALVVSIPLGFFGGIGGASKNGILIKGSNFLEALNDVHTVVFDKTGTLTKGVFKVTRINPTGNLSKEVLLECAALAESYSTHPIALSILKAYEKDIDKSRISVVEEIPGHGVKVTIDGKEILVGNKKLMLEHSIPVEDSTSGTLVHIAVERNYEGFIVISDEIKEDSSKAIKELKALGIKKTVMLTGDHHSTAKEIAEELKLDEFHSQLLPHEKVEKLEFIQNQMLSKQKLIFVGDGINDAPVLARADIGVAMGGLGSDAAIEAADIVLMTDEPSKLVSAIKIANKTRRIVWENIIFALGVKIFVLALGAFGFATMWAAVFSDVGVALIAVLNAMRVINTKIN
ncbi:heavy metal translocating P-type ATPase [Defluviitalea saccharophila]|uniref:Cd(2+)-exporting ATPase n=1 Tax=Defluviitalea saccharophila TaxID=879970 RepID=A0ABZ2Y0J9_9FIRM